MLSCEGRRLGGARTHTPVDRGNHVWRLIINMPAGQKCKSDPTKSAVERFMETFPAVIAEDR